MTTSSAILTDLATVIAAQPSSATSTANAIAAAGPIIDLLGMLILAQSKCKETKVLLNNILAVMDAGDGQKGTVTNIKNTFV